MGGADNPLVLWRFFRSPRYTFSNTGPVCGGRTVGMNTMMAGLEVGMTVPAHVIQEFLGEPVRVLSPRHSGGARP